MYIYIYARPKTVKIPKVQALGGLGACVLGFRVYGVIGNWEWGALLASHVFFPMSHDAEGVEFVLPHRGRRSNG